MEQRSMSSLEKGMQILGLLSRQRTTLRVGEVCRSLDIPKSSASRLLRAMANSGILMQEPGGQGYVVGPRAVELAGLYLADHGLLELVETIVDSLVAEFGFVGYVSVMDGGDLLILRRKYGTYPLRVVRDVGQRVFAYRTAAGRVLLARGTDDEALAIIDRDPQWRARADEAIAEIRRIRHNGVATSTSSFTPGVAATAAAIADPQTGELMSVSVSFPLAATDHDIRTRIRVRLREEAQRIGTLIGDRFWTDRTSTPADDIEASPGLPPDAPARHGVPDAQTA
jgi:DNA-binding IclR family transcriptional regulator